MVFSMRQSSSIFIILFFMSGCLAKRPIAYVTPEKSLILGKKALDYTNNFRQRQGLPPVAWHYALTAAAQAHSAAMARHDVPFGHDGSKQRIASLPLRAYRSSENVYMTNAQGNTAKDAVDGWIASPGHHANLIGDYNHCGVGVCQNSDGYWYYTQIFTRF